MRIEVSNVKMNVTDSIRQKKIREKFSDFVDALNEYNMYVEPEYQIKANKEISELAEKIFGSCDVLNKNED